MGTPAQFGSSQFGLGLFGGTAVVPPDAGLIPIVRILIDQTKGDVFWSSQQLYDAANEVILDFWASGKVQITNIPFVLSSGADIVPYNTSTSSLMIPQFVVLNTTTANSTIFQGYWISDRTKLEQWSRFWRTADQGLPKWFILFDDFNIRVFPSPDQSYTFQLWGVPYPNEISSTQEDLIVNGAGADRMFKLAIAYKVSASLLLYSRPDVSAAYEKLSEEALYYFKKRLRNQSPNNIRRMKPMVSSRQDSTVAMATRGVISIGRKLS